jgi:hypothetical protein
MAVALKTLFNKRQLALTRAKFRAWWEGDDFDEAAALAAIDAAANANEAEMTGADDALFDEPPFDMPPRLAALAALWGEGRVRPGDAVAEKLEPARAAIAAEGVLAVLGPGLVAPVIAFAEAHPGKIEVFEWREETLEALKYGVRKARLEARVTVSRIDLDTHVFAAARYDGLLSTDDFAYCGHPPYLALQMVKCLKPGASAVVETYVGLPSDLVATAFASAFAEPQIKAHGDVLQVLTDAGLTVDSDEDVTEEFLDFARQGFKQLGEALTNAAQLDVGAARELAWEAEAWRTRMKLLAQRRLERRRIVLRRPPEGATAPAPQAEKTNAPAA